MTGLVGNHISLLVIVFPMLLNAFEDCPIRELALDETIVRFSAHYDPELCDNYTHPANVDVIQNVMVKKWKRARTLSCYQNYEGSHFIVGYVNCHAVHSNAHPVEFNCEHNFTDYCPYSYILGFTAWSNVHTTSGGPTVENCIQTRHIKSVSVYGGLPVESFNMLLRCDDNARCLDNAGVSVMYLKYKDNRYDRSDPNLMNCNLCSA